MARSRNIKPGFFTNDALAELPALTRLLFVGIWTLADREGRLEDRPKKIKAECMPYDDLDAEKAIQSLADAGFLQRYEVGGVRCILVVTWGKHQNPHIKEQPSLLPAPEKHGASTVQAQDKPDECTEVAGLIPDSGFLIPDSLQNQSNLTVAPAFPGEKQQLALVGPPEPPEPKGPPDCPHLAILALWAEVLPALPQHMPAMWKGSRASHLRARWRETATEKGWQSESEGLTYFRRLFGYIGQSRFLTGRAPPARDRPPFIAELAWVAEPGPWAKLIEGKYHQEAA